MMVPLSEREAFQMSNQFDLKKEWEKTKIQLQRFSQEAAVFAKKGEQELVEFSRKGKLHLDSTALVLKIEHLYYLIGKEYVKNSRSAQPASGQLDKLIKEITKLEKDHKLLQVKMRRAPSKKKAAN